MRSFATQGSSNEQQVSGIAEILGRFWRRASTVRDEQKTRSARSAAFVFLVAKTGYGIADQESTDGIVNEGNDFGGPTSCTSRRRMTAVFRSR